MLQSGVQEKCESLVTRLVSPRLLTRQDSCRVPACCFSPCIYEGACAYTYADARAHKHANVKQADEKKWRRNAHIRAHTHTHTHTHTHSHTRTRAGAHTQRGVRRRCFATGKEEFWCKTIKSSCKQRVLPSFSSHWPLAIPHILLLSFFTASCLSGCLSPLYYIHPA